MFIEIQNVIWNLSRFDCFYVDKNPHRISLWRDGKEVDSIGFES